MSNCHKISNCCNTAPFVADEANDLDEVGYFSDDDGDCDDCIASHYLLIRLLPACLDEEMKTTAANNCNDW